MSKNLRGLSERKGLSDNILEEIKNYEDITKSRKLKFAGKLLLVKTANMLWKPLTTLPEPCCQRLG